MKNKKTKKTMKWIIVAGLIFSANLNSATHTVTNGNDNGAGSLRQIAFDAGDGDTILFASNVSEVNLTSCEIWIYNNLTIIGGSDTTRKVTINGNNSRIFWIEGFFTVNINNLILINGYASTSNTLVGGGAIYIICATLTATNCIFYKNSAMDMPGSVIYLDYFSVFIAINCTFVQNSTNNNSGAIHIRSKSTAYLYHCTIDNNVENGISNNNLLYAYNCVFTGNTLNQIQGTVSGGSNLIEGENGVTRDLVFGNNTLTDSGYIMPLEYAKSAPRLTANDIEVPAGFSADSIISWLYADQRGKIRPDSGLVTFGAVEYDESSIKELGLLIATSIYPNPTTDYFTVSFELEKPCNLEILLYDVLGREILEIHNGFTVEGLFIKKIDVDKLVSGVYFIKISIDNDYIIKKITIN